MSTVISRSYPRAVLLGILVLAAASSPSLSYAVTTNIVSDGTLPTPTNVTGPAVVDLNGGNVYSINQGTINGVNQFHSLQHLNVGLPAGALPGAVPDIASFDGPAGIQNILARVTSGDISQIDGGLRSTIDGANLFLMNPSGIMFGPNAQLNLLNGSFAATTADRIRFDDAAGTLFNAVASGADASLGPIVNPLLATAAPAAFGFLPSNPFTASIDVQRGGFDFVTFTPNRLAVPDGQTLSLVGGTLNLGTADGSAPAYVHAPGGTVNLVSVASPGEATFNSSPINVDGFAQLGDINIRGGSIIDGKDIFIRSGQLTMGAPVDPTDPSSPILPGIISPGLFSLFFFIGPPVDDGNVDIDVANDMTIQATGPDPILFQTGGISTITGFFGEAKAPDLTIHAGSLSISGFAGVVFQRFGDVGPSQLTFNLDNSLTLEKGGTIGLLNFYKGSPGDILITAGGDVNIIGDGSPGPIGTTGIIGQGLFNPSASCNCDPNFTFADSGSIDITAGGTLTVIGDAVISTSSAAYGSSNDINIAANDIVLSGRPAHIDSTSFFAGPSGNVNITATGRIDINDGFVIRADTNGTGAGGTVNITAGDSINISGEASGIATQTAPPPQSVFDFFAQSAFFEPDYATFLANRNLPADTDMFQLLAFLEGEGFTVLQEPLEAGDGAGILVAAPTLTLDGLNAAIDSGTGWDGNAGDVEVTANKGSITVSGGAQIRSRSGLLDFEANQGLVGSGEAGTVTVKATDSISITGADSSISTSTFGNGNGGDIFLTAGNAVVLQNGGSVTSDSGGELAGELFTGDGLAGNINVTATGDQIFLSNGQITTQTLTANGGNIELKAPSIVRLENSTISTSVAGAEGEGGDITIEPEFVVLNKSAIIANAFGGPGGNILIIADNFIPSADSVVQASSQFGVQGTVVIASPENNIAGSIAQLPQEIVDVSGLLPERCAARGGGGAQNSFVVAGRGGLPTNPDNYLPSFNAGSVPLKSAGGPPPSDTTEATLTSARDIAVAMAAWNCVPGSERRVKIQEVISQLF